MEPDASHQRASDVAFPLPRIGAWLTLLALAALAAPRTLPEPSARPDRDGYLLPIERWEPPRLEWHHDRVQSGETFAALMDRWGMSPQRVANTVDATRPVFDLGRLRAGTPYAVGNNALLGLTEWRYDFDPERTLVVRLHDDGEVEPYVEERPFERRQRGLDVQIQTSLFGSLSPNGERDALPFKIAQIFGWQVDFHHDLRAGDRVEVLYETLVRDGKVYGTGQVLAATLTVSGRRLESWRHESNGQIGYYDADGLSLRKQFLKAPLEYGRISSGFSHRRLHPVLKRYRAHLGVDYAASSGTPIHATADGTVQRVTSGRGEGKYVVLRHANGFETWYLHMSRFARGLRRGKRIAQGETIGYVGSTGYATGPHVDYRIKKAGSFVNPRTVVVPPAPPLAKDELAEFKARRAELAREFDQLVSAPTAGNVTAG